MIRYNSSVNRVVVLATLVAGICAIFLQQFATHTLYGIDGHLHIRMAQFLRDLGPHYQFHWARYSVFFDNFSDKDFLYHLMLIPFTWFKDIFFGAKIAAALFASILFAVYALMLNRYSDYRIRVFFMLAFFLSYPFCNFISFARPMTVVLFLTLGFFHFAIIRKSSVVFIISMIYTLTHVTGPIMIFYAFIIEAVRYQHKREFCVRMIAMAFFGVIAGFLIHPNFPANIRVFYLNSILVPLYCIKGSSIEFPSEFSPANTKYFIIAYPMVFFSIIYLMFAAVFNKVRTSFETKVFFVLSLPFLALSMTGIRYAVHCYLILLLAVAGYITDSLKHKEKLSRFLISVMVILSLVLGANSFVKFKHGTRFNHAMNTHYERVANIFKEIVPEGEIIFHASWGDSPFFIGLNPKNDYLVTLDPIYMYAWDPKFYYLYKNLVHGKTKDPYTIIKERFRTRYGYISIKVTTGIELYKQIIKDKRFRILYKDDLGVIFVIKNNE
ncbi:hypothetical protein ACFL0T_00205 [Candidatus Omnitrophota bacterium]